MRVTKSHCRSLNSHLCKFVVAFTENRLQNVEEARPLDNSDVRGRACGNKSFPRTSALPPPFDGHE